MSITRRTPVDISAWGDTPPLFITLLAAEVRASNRKIAGERIGMSRTAVALVLANKYPSPSTAGIERRVMATLGRRDCPAMGERISTQQCRDYRERPAPTHNPMAMRVWRVCQTCPHNPDCHHGDAS